MCSPRLTPVLALWHGMSRDVFWAKLVKRNTSPRSPRDSWRFG